MEHLGDITKISGYTAPAVDVIVGGSPCQDLSIAGKGAGLKGERSGLFMEQIRIIKEMRQRDVRDGRTGVAIRPRYMVWENVPGAFSSNAGEDFRVVLEETAKIADEAAAIPRPPKGKWTNAGCIMGDGWSIAWRVLDARFWGVPQRRRRIALVADFGGASAPEILFVRKGVCGDTAESGVPGKAAAGDAATSAGTDDCLSFQERAGKPGGGKGILIQRDRIGCLSTLQNQYVVAGFSYRAGARAGSIGFEENKSATLAAHRHDAAILVQEAVAIENHSQDSRVKITGDVTQTLSRKDGTGGNNVPLVMTYRQRLIVRRLTPLECERLQGYPDGWTDIGEWTDSKGKRHKEADSPRYMALGNSIALPVWKWVMKRISAQDEREATMASLFDGIGGFPYIWEQLNGKGSCLWASEIEEFPMAVTKVRIG